MKLGVVSNCWQCRLEAGTDLLDLVVGVSDAGLECVELRQTCLGRFEQGPRCVPDPATLRELPAAAPSLEFDLAVDVPFLQPGAVESTPIFATAVGAAQSIAGQHRPHLRLVDLTTTSQQLQSVDVSLLSQSVVGLAERMIEVDGWLSIEHSLQSWAPFLEVFRTARRLLGDRGDNLRLCYDPVNLFLGDASPRPSEVTRSLAADEISMVHFKQRRDGVVLPRMEDGDVDWHDQAAALQEIGYDGPFLFEVRWTDDVERELEVSLDYVRACGFIGLGSA